MAVHKIDGGPGGQTNHYPKKFVTLYSADAATNAIAKGDWVAIDLGDTTNGLGMSVEQAAMTTGAGDPLVFGVATHALSVAGYLVVQTAGFYGYNGALTDAAAAGEGAATDGGVIAGAPLVAGDDGAAGQIDTYEAGTHTNANIVGIALVADGQDSYGNNETSVIILDQGLF